MSLVPPASWLWKAGAVSSLTCCLRTSLYVARAGWYPSTSSRPIRDAAPIRNEILEFPNGGGPLDSSGGPLSPCHCALLAHRP